MKSLIEKTFKRADLENRRVFIPYMTGGFPDAGTCLELIKALDENGADLIEIGLPFSDPLADGPVIQKAGKTALDNGATPASILKLVSEAKKTVRAPLIIMTYYNPILRMGPDQFAARCAKAGTSGVIVPDLPPEEAGKWIEAAAANDLATIFMVAPTTTPERRKLILEVCQGFLYYVSLTGVTGSSINISPELGLDLTRTRSQSPVPVAVGFGVSGPEQAAALAPLADGVIVGSALVKKVLDHETPDDRIKSMADLAKDISRALSLQDRAA